MKRHQPREQHADSVLVLRLQGFLFFGAANRIRDEIRQESDNALNYLILDFQHVLRVDDTAIPVLKDLQRLANKRGFELIVSRARGLSSTACTGLKVAAFLASTLRSNGGKLKS